MPNQTAQLLEQQLHCTIRVRYLLYLPERAPRAGTGSWPLILFLHGAGERGTRLSKVSAHGPPRVVLEQLNFPFVVVSPLCPAGQLWSNDHLLALLDKILELYPVDRSQVYLTGLSMGGYGTWRLGLAHPERFAAIAPLCGGGDILPLLLADPKQLRAIRTLGVWAFHGGKDPSVPLAESERMVASLREAGNPAKLTVYPEAGHDCWTETYRDPAFYAWLLTHRRK